ncbi:MAG TPA: ABC transporter permease [Candidatus Limiplasma sp.]|nr:ABC transporter permease [Candidatus Limiplasma sp.]
MNDITVRGSKAGNIISRIVRLDQFALALCLLLLWILMAMLSPVFLTATNILNLFRQSSMVGIASLGMCLIVLSGEIDLSIAPMQAAVGVIVVYLLNKTGSLFLAFFAGLAAGVLVSAMIAALVTKGNIASLIVTLGMASVVKGVVLVVTNSASIQNSNNSLAWIGTGYIGPIPVPIILFLVLIIVFYLFLNRTIYGRNFYAIGGNQNAARLSGLNVIRYKFSAFIIGGLMSALAAIILTSRLNSGQPTAGTGFEMQVISAVVLGGVSLNGGRGTLPGVIIGVFILSTLQNGLTLLNVNSFYQELIRGVVLLLAVYLDGRKMHIKPNRRKELHAENTRGES